jgi:hypothetical protein
MLVSKTSRQTPLSKLKGAQFNTMTILSKAPKPIGTIKPIPGYHQCPNGPNRPAIG